MIRPAVVAIVCVLCGSGRAAERSLVVAADGSGDAATIQAAIAMVPKDSQQRTLIHIKAGIYPGPIVIARSKRKITLEGDGPDKTILTWDRNTSDPAPPRAWSFNPGVMVAGDDFEARSLTIRNTSGDHGPAVALRVDGDRAVFRDCHILGWQDTLMVNDGRDYFDHCTIAGRVDFIFGSATAWFEHCDIHSRNGGCVTAASTPAAHPFGLIFHDCRLTGDADPFVPATTNPTAPAPASAAKPKVTPRALLGRPWRPFGSVMFLDCWMGSHITPRAWDDWGDPKNQTTARFAEHHNIGPGAATDRRAPWSHPLTDEQAGRITIPVVMGGDDHWDPTAREEEGHE